MHSLDSVLALLSAAIYHLSGVPYRPFYIFWFRSTSRIISSLGSFLLYWAVCGAQFNSFDFQFVVLFFFSFHFALYFIVVWTTVFERRRDSSFVKFGPIARTPNISCAFDIVTICDVFSCILRLFYVFSAATIAASVIYFWFLLIYVCEKRSFQPDFINTATVKELKKKKQQDIVSVEVENKSSSNSKLRRIGISVRRDWFQVCAL